MFASEVVVELEIESEVDVGWSSEDWWVSVASSGRAVLNRHPSSVATTIYDFVGGIVATREG